MTIANLGGWRRPLCLQRNHSMRFTFGRGNAMMHMSAMQSSQCGAERMTAA
jgi:hypothetical protein